MTLVTAWKCACGAQNHAEHAVCRICKAPRPSEVKLYPHVQTSTTPEIPGHRTMKCLGVVKSTVVLGVNLFRDAAAELRDIVGGRSKAYEEELNKGTEEVLRELRGEADALGANAVVGIRLDYEALGLRNSMLMVIAQGTAVIVEPVKNHNSG